jgi:hypothetical protein
MAIPSRATLRRPIRARDLLHADVQRDGIEALRRDDSGDFFSLTQRR